MSRFATNIDRAKESRDVRRHKRVANSVRKTLQDVRKAAASRGALPDQDNPERLMRRAIRGIRAKCRKHRAAGGN